MFLTFRTNNGAVRRSRKKGEKMTEREQTTIRLPRELKRELEERAREKGISLNSEIIILLHQALGEK